MSSVTISPLYTNNQNSYFFHGLARANHGHLEEDFLFSTQDPFPLFSSIVEFVHTSSIDLLFFVLHSALLIIYFLSLSNISKLGIGRQRNIVPYLLISFLLILVHSAASGFLSKVLFGMDLSRIFYDGVAGQTLVNAELQPSTFGVLCITAIFFYTKRMKYISVCLIAISSYIHASYVLVGFIIIFAFVLHTYVRRRSTRDALQMGLVAGVLIGLPALWHYWRFKPDDLATLKSATEILVLHRMPHHALVSSWLGISTLVKVGMCVIAIYLTRKNTLGFLLSFLLFAGLVLSCIQYITDNYQFALLFPWRISVVLIPISLSVILGGIARLSFQKFFAFHFEFNRISKFFLVSLIAACAITGGIYTFLRTEKVANMPYQPAFSFAKSSAKSGHLYMIPPNMINFRLSTGIPVFTDGKTHPFKASETIEWFSRLESVSTFYSASQVNCDTLKTILVDNGITHTLVELDSAIIECGLGSVAFKDENYLILLHEKS